MYGLYCDHDDKCRKLLSIQPINIITYISKKNPLMESFIKSLPYEQSNCSFCCKSFDTNDDNIINNLVIVLKCKHVFHLQCFVNHSKWKYIDNLKKKSLKNIPTTDDTTTDDTTTDDTTTDENTTDENTTDDNTTTDTTDDTTTDENTNNDSITDDTLNNDCILCKTRTPNFLSVFETYKQLLQDLQKLQSDFQKSMLY
jgi:hypothetical protein